MDFYFIENVEIEGGEVFFFQRWSKIQGGGGFSYFYIFWYLCSFNVVRNERGNKERGRE